MKHLKFWIVYPLAWIVAIGICLTAVFIAVKSVELIYLMWKPLLSNNHFAHVLLTFLSSVFVFIASMLLGAGIGDILNGVRWEKEGGK